MLARILIIDDEPIIAMVLKEILVDEGNEICVAANGLIGLRMLEQEPLPDIILIDLLMPGMGGRDFVITARSKPKLANIPFILITGAIPNVKDLPPEGSYQDIIQKPFDIEDVISKINTLLAALSTKME